MFRYRIHAALADAPEEVRLPYSQTRNMVSIDIGRATINGSTRAIVPSNRTCLPVIILHIGRNTESYLFMKSAQNR